MISIIIPARNEELYLPAALDSIQRAAACCDEAVEIVVVINRCSDRTQRIAEERSCVVVKDDSKNLSKIRNSGAKRSSGNILVTMDADSRMSVNMLSEIIRVLREEPVVGGGVCMLPERWSLGILATGLALAPIALRYGISGGLFYCRRETFWAIRGFDERLVSVEDIDFARRLRAYGKEHGLRFKTIFRAQITTSCRKFDRFGDWYLLKHPKEFIELLRGKNQELANKIWYDFER